MKIQILIENKKYWKIPYSKLFVLKIKKIGYNINLIFSHEQFKKGDLLFHLSWKKINNEKVKIIAEVGINHNGNYEECLKLIEAAANAQADSVKLKW